MSIEKKLFPHYPVVRLDSETGQYYLTQYLYTNTPDFGKKWPTWKLAVEYQPVMLPKWTEEELVELRKQK